MNRVVVYIDGFNLYHAIAELGDERLKWLDLWALANSLLRAGETLAAVNYFSAYATWRPSAFAKHRSYVAALKATGVTVKLGNFKKKERNCRKCGASWVAHEEKETDVRIAIAMVYDAIKGGCERMILISADSDLVPAVQMAKAHSARHVEILVVAPPGRFSAARDLGPRLELTAGRLRQSLLSPRIVNGSGYTVASCPSDWA